MATIRLAGCWLFLLLGACCFLGSLERVDLEVFCLDLNLDVSCKITDTVQPFLLRGRIRATYFSDSPFNYALTPFTIICNNLT